MKIVGVMHRVLLAHLDTDCCFSLLYKWLYWECCNKTYDIDFGYLGEIVWWDKWGVNYGWNWIFFLDLFELWLYQWNPCKPLFTQFSMIRKGSEIMIHHPVVSSFCTLYPWLNIIALRQCSSNLWKLSLHNLFESMGSS